MSPFSFDLPAELIAQHPPSERDGGRLLWVRGDEPPRHQAVLDLPDLLERGDLLVVNDTRVMRARLDARRATGGRVEVLLLEPGPVRAQALVKPGRRLKIGEELALEDEHLRLVERHDDGSWTVEGSQALPELMQRHGALPLPPYIDRPDDEGDAERYQTVFADALGAAAAPTAGLHLSDRLLARLSERDIELAQITLHVGLGTFRPLREEDLERGELHPEWYRVPPETVAAVEACRARGGRVVAIGTTSCRALESATPPGQRVPIAGEGVTRLFLREGDPTRCVDGLLTNFHLPGTSLLHLVCALGGRERLERAYRAAVSERYRFYSYGDAMLLLRDPRDGR